MGQLDASTFDQAIHGACTCGATTVEIHSFLDRVLVVMAGDPNDAGRWAHDGEKLIDGTYRVACTRCGRVRFASADCPRCHAAEGLTRALGEPNRLRVPKRCPRCAELELLANALIPATTRYGTGEPPRPRPLGELGDPGYHVVAYACDACDHAVVAEGCPLCGAPGPLRARP
jgi:hypothetical protein